MFSCTSSDPTQSVKTTPVPPPPSPKVISKSTLPSPQNVKAPSKKKASPVVKESQSPTRTALPYIPDLTPVL